MKKLEQDLRQRFNSPGWEDDTVNANDLWQDVANELRTPKPKGKLTFFQPVLLFTLLTAIFSFGVIVFLPTEEGLKSQIDRTDNNENLISDEENRVALALNNSVEKLSKVGDGSDGDPITEMSNHDGLQKINRLNDTQNDHELERQSPTQKVQQFNFPLTEQAPVFKIDDVNNTKNGSKNILSSQPVQKVQSERKDDDQVSESIQDIVVAGNNSPIEDQELVPIAEHTDLYSTRQTSPVDSTVKDSSTLLNEIRETPSEGEKPNSAAEIDNSNIQVSSQEFDNTENRKANTLKIERKGQTQLFQSNVKLLLGGGLNGMFINSSSNNSEDLGSRLDTAYRFSIGYGLDVAVQVNYKNWEIITGLSLNQYQSTLDYTYLEDVEDYSEVEPILISKTDPETGETSEEMAYSYYQGDGTFYHKVKHANRFQMMTLPVLIGRSYNSNKFTLGAWVGPSFTFVLNQEGRVLTKPNDFKEFSESVPLLNKFQMGLLLSTRIEYSLSERLGLYFSPNYNWLGVLPNGTHSVQSSYHLMNLNLGMIFQF